MSQYRVVTFNLKNDMPLTRKFLKWETRRNAVISCLKDLQADIIGVQEFTDEMRKSFNLYRFDYDVVGRPRNKNPKATSERTDIFYKKSKFKCLESKTFWLSNNPEKEGSRLFFSPFPRICTMARLQDKSSGQIINVYNTHLDHLTSYTRKKEIEILITHIKEHQYNESIILMGDLNTTHFSKAIKLLHSSSLSLKTIYQSKKTFNTMHFGGGKKSQNKEPIDYIFVSKNFEVAHTEIFTKSYNNIYPSDHFPVLCILKTKKEKNGYSV